ncbi:MAG: alpha-hydroxy-acid oxidizing protein, partial [Solirubrobacterales bacterium]|nr:alpha-hydroxy-acid oxidizing protein [Solirubrobacterales bacterium]
TFFGAYGEWMLTPPPSWEDLRWLREEWDGPLMLKGFMRADDAGRAVDAGFSAISVSNHGANNLDGTPASIRALPTIAQAVGDQIEVLLDGGISAGRRGQGARARRQSRNDRPRVPVGPGRRGSGGGREGARHHALRHRLHPARPRSRLGARPFAG